MLKSQFANKNRTATNIAIFAITLAVLAILDNVPALHTNPVISIIAGVTVAVVLVILFRVLDTMMVKAEAKK
jgi:capsular polysaccharide biosynthesis protein